MKTLSILLLILSFSQCGSTKFQKNTSFIIDSANYMTWTGEQPGIHGINVQIQLKEKSSITFDSLYFRNKATKVEIKEASLIIANYTTSKNKNLDVTLHLDPKKEFKNKLPVQKKIPFELSKKEAVLSYQLNGETKYYKIKEIKERDTKLTQQIQ
ncbi:hypothetical protein H0I29_05970 [Polaribacter sp. R2A056_3_33]|uniref:hypothetical protein n=1 Tax=Polaribacter sp. R2A056_3_33 TaxID=2745563 RepID=UPI001C4ED031|nr:hypothetical protein [Polaribacter sp. R2A056_3_33]QXP71627.1 hypothetical protein H0I29_05970 [Polaribacter sp. R2A056_3_33]